MADEGSKLKLIFEGQFGHLFCTALLIAALYQGLALPGIMDGSFLGLSTLDWILLAVANAITHQVYVWICWRIELHGKILTRILGDNAFLFYQIGFAILILLRPVLVFALGWSNRGTLMIEPWVGYLISLLLLGPVVYMMYSVKHYFSFRRAFGIDHFDAAYRNAPLVRQGIFRWTPNAMYVFGIGGLWIPAFLFQSEAAALVAAFSHAYIWVHYFFTEKPDMRRIYG
ncbi:MAG: hypothetical protein HQ503_02120 [Rhodospirillales bacterium]|nr:hypothetical protein [Rhodospirillales bacterium]